MSAPAKAAKPLPTRIMAAGWFADLVDCSAFEDGKAYRLQTPDDPTGDSITLRNVPDAMIWVSSRSGLYVPTTRLSMLRTLARGHTPRRIKGRCFPPSIEIEKRNTP